MKKPLIFVVIICLVGLVWFVFQNNRVITPASNSSSLEVNTSQVVDIKKYFNQPITLVKEDWPLAENTVDKKRSIFKSEDFNLVAATKTEGASVYYVQAQINRNIECSAKNAAEQMKITLGQVGLSDMYEKKPQQENPDSKLFCVKNENLVINTSCSFGSKTYVVSIGEYDSALCN